MGQQSSSWTLSWGGRNGTSPFQSHILFTHRKGEIYLSLSSLKPISKSYYFGAACALLMEPSADGQPVTSCWSGDVSVKSHMCGELLPSVGLPLSAQVTALHPGWPQAVRRVLPSCATAWAPGSSCRVKPLSYHLRGAFKKNAFNLFAKLWCHFIFR